MEVLAQAMDLNYEECFGFGQAFWNDAEEEIHLSLVAVDQKGLSFLEPSTVTI